MIAWPLPNVTSHRLARNVRVVFPALRFWLRISTRPDTPLTRQTLTRPVGWMRRRTRRGVAACRRLRCLEDVLTGVAVAVAVAVGLVRASVSDPPLPHLP